MHISRAFLNSIKQFRLLHLTTGMRGEFLLYSTSTGVMQASRLITSLLAAKLLGPTASGWWNSLQPLLIYGVMLHFGVLNGMNREVPYHVGKGDATKAEYIRRVSWGIALISAGAAALICFVCSFLVTDNSLVTGALQMLSLALIMQQWYLYKSMLLVSAIRFKLLSIQQFSQGFLFPIFALSLTHVMGLNGFILGQAIVNFIVCLLMTRLTHYDIRPVFDWDEALRLGKVGFPIMMAGFFYDLLRTLDRWVILAFLGVTDVGFYTLAILALQAITLLPNVITAQFYPRMSKKYGETHSLVAVKSLLRKAFLGSAALIWPFGLFVMLGLKPFTQYFMPEYTSGIVAAIIITAGATISRPFAGSSATYLNAVGRGNAYMNVQIVMVFLQLVLTISAALLGQGLLGVAWAVAITQIINALMLSGILIFLIRQEGRIS